MKERYQEDDVGIGGLQIVQGTLDVLVLGTLARGPLHGYGVARLIRESTDGELRVEDRALYVALHRLEERGWIAAEWGVSENKRRAKYYELTAEGRLGLEAELDQWSRYVSAVNRVLEGG